MRKSKLQEGLFFYFFIFPLVYHSTFIYPEKENYITLNSHRLFSFHHFVRYYVKISFTTPSPITLIIDQREGFQKVIHS